MWSLDEAVFHEPGARDSTADPAVREAIDEQKMNGYKLVIMPETLAVRLVVEGRSPLPKMTKAQKYVGTGSSPTTSGRADKTSDVFGLLTPDYPSLT
jgi:hypothetical protein